MRKRRTLAVVTVLLLGVTFWPWLGNPFGYVHLRDSVRTSIPIALVFGQRCATYEDNVIRFDPSPTCYKFDKPKFYRGIWLYEFEGSRFVEGATVIPARMPDAGSTAWLNYDPEHIDPTRDYDYDPDKHCYPIHAFAISFIGRRNPQGGGHLGLFASEIWPQKILSAKALPSPDCETYRG